MLENTLFTVVDILPVPVPGQRCFFLVRDNWNDWFKYETTFRLYTYAETGHCTDIGSVKIGRIGMTPEERKPPIPETFEQLDSAFFSVGQDENYYETIAELPSGFGEVVFKALRDCAYDSTIFEMTRHQNVMTESLLRGVSSQRVTGRFRKLAYGHVELTSFGFVYRFAADTPEPSTMPICALAWALPALRW